MTAYFFDDPAQACPLTDEIPTALTAWRANAGLSQAELAARMGLTQARVSQIERGHDRSYVSVWRYAAALGLTVVVDIREQTVASELPAFVGKDLGDELKHPVELVQRFLGNGSRA